MLAIAAAPMLIAILYYMAIGHAQLDGDSPCYLQWCPKRTSVYPVFLNLVEGPWLLPVQLGLLAGSLTWLAWYSFRLFGSLLLSAVLTFGIMANPYVWQLQGSVMSEALTTPLLIVLLGCTTGFLVRGSPTTLLAASFAAGVMAAARPGVLPILIIPLAALWLANRTAGQKLKLSALCVLVWVAPIAADRAYTRAVLGDRMTSLAGRHIFAKAALIDAPPLDRSGMGAVDRRLANLLERDLQPVREVLRPLHGNVRQIVRLNYEVCLQYACGERLTGDLHLPRAELDDALVRVGTARLERNPGAYLSLAWDNYRGLWQLHPRKHPDLAREYNAFLKTSAPLPFQPLLGEEGQIVPSDQQREYYRYDRLVLIAIGVAVPILILLFLIQIFRRSGEPLGAGSLAILVGLEAVLVFAALFGVGIPRYVMGMWPAIVAGFALAGYHLLMLLPHPNRHAAT